MPKRSKPTSPTVEPHGKVIAVTSDEEILATMLVNEVIWKGRQHLYALVALDEGISAMMKTARDCLEGGSHPRAFLDWIALFDLSGRGGQAWHILFTLALEDVGLANPLLFAELVGLYGDWCRAIGGRSAPTSRSFSVPLARSLLAEAGARVACSFKSRWAANTVHWATVSVAVVETHLPRRGATSAPPTTRLLELVFSPSAVDERTREVACAHFAIIADADALTRFFDRCEAEIKWPQYGVLSALRTIRTRLVGRLGLSCGACAQAVLLAYGATRHGELYRPEAQRTWFVKESATPSAIYAKPFVRYDDTASLFAIRAMVPPITPRDLDKHTDRGKWADKREADGSRYNSVKNLRKAAASVGVDISSWPADEVARTHGDAPLFSDGRTLQQRFYEQGMMSAAPSRWVPTTHPLFAEAQTAGLELERVHGLAACKQEDRMRRYAAAWAALY